jgi:hypothetical protein
MEPVLRIDARHACADVSDDFARGIWQRIETINAVVYFDDAPIEAAKAVGSDGFWMTYFGLRAAPFGAVTPAVVDATFFNFEPQFVRRWVPEVWARSEPSAWLDVRRIAVSRALRRHDAAALQTATRSFPTLRAVIEGASAPGRPLFAANRDVDAGDDDAAQLWQACTTIREHRGDGHVAALTAAGLDGIEAHVLIAIERGTPSEMLQRSRGWTDGHWSAALARLAGRGLVSDGRLTKAGAVLRADVEATTDRLAAAPFTGLDHAGRQRLLDQLTPLAVTISRSGVLRYPNPMSLPQLDN